MKKTSVALAALALSTVALTAACSSSSGSSSAASSAASPAASSSMVGGMATCDDTTITAEIEKELEAAGEGVKLWGLDGLNCADGWATVQPTVGKTEGEAVTETVIFQAEGQFWIPKNAMDVCGTQGDDPSVRPADAQVPEAIYAEACGTN